MRLWKLDGSGQPTGEPFLVEGEVDVVLGLDYGFEAVTPVLVPSETSFSVILPTEDMVDLLLLMRFSVDEVDGMITEAVQGRLRLSSWENEGGALGKELA